MLEAVGNALPLVAVRQCEYVQDQSGVWKICIFGLGGLRNPNPLSYNSTCFPSRKPFFQTRNLNDVSKAKMFGGECIFVGYAAWGHEPNMLGLRLVLVHDRRPIDS